MTQLYIFFYILFSIMTHHRILNIVPVLDSRALLFIHPIRAFSWFLVLIVGHVSMLNLFCCKHLLGLSFDASPSISWVSWDLSVFSGSQSPAA